MAKARMYGMNKQFIPNSKADSRNGKKVFGQQKETCRQNALTMKRLHAVSERKKEKV